MKAQAADTAARARQDCGITFLSMREWFRRWS